MFQMLTPETIKLPKKNLHTFNVSAAASALAVLAAWRTGFFLGLKMRVTALYNNLGK